MSLKMKFWNHQPTSQPAILHMTHKHMAHHCHSLSNLDDDLQEPHQPVMKKILSMGVPDLSVLSDVVFEAENNVESQDFPRKDPIPYFLSALTKEQPQSVASRCNISENTEINLQALESGSCCNTKVQPNFDHLNLSIDTSCCTSKEYDSFFKSKEGFVIADQFSSISSKKKASSTLYKSNGSVHSSGKCENISHSSAIYDEPAPRELEATFYPQHITTRNPKFRRNGDVTCVMHIPDNLDANNVPNAKDFNNQIPELKDVDLNNTLRCKNSQNDEVAVADIVKYVPQETATESTVLCGKRQKSSTFSKNLKDFDLSSNSSRHSELSKNNSHAELFYLPEKCLHAHVGDNSCKEKSKAENIMLAKTFCNTNFNAKINVPNKDSNFRIFGAETGALKTEESNMHKDASTKNEGNFLSYISSTNIFEYLRKQDEKILAIQNQLSRILMHQTNFKTTLNEHVCQAIDENGINAKLSLIDACLKKMNDNSYSKCFKEVLEKNFDLLMHFKDQNEQIKKLQYQITLLLNQANEQPSTLPKRFIDTCDNNAINNISLTGKANSEHKMLKNVNGSIHNFHENTFMTISCTESTKVKKACAASSMTSIAINNDDKLVCSEVLTIITDISKYEKESFHSFQKKYQLCRNMKQFSEEKHTFFFEANDKIKGPQAFMPRQYPSFTDELNGLSLVYKDMPILDSSTSVNSIHLDVKEFPGSLCCENFSGSCSVCRLEEKRNEVMGAFSQRYNIMPFSNNILTNVNKLILDHDHQCRTEPSLPCYSQHKSSYKKDSKVTYLPCMTGTVSEGASIAFVHANAENSKGLESSSTSKDVACSINKSIPWYVDRSSIAKYGLSSPNLSVATKDYLESYGLVINKSFR